MLTYRTDPVVIVGYDMPVDDDGKPKFTYRGGIPFENCRYTVDGEDRYREVALSPELNGGRPKPGDRVVLVIHSIPSEKARTSKAGRPYIAHEYKDRLVAAEPAK